MKPFILLSFLGWSSLFSFENVQRENGIESFSTMKLMINKAEAFTVLDEKCNVCHEDKKRVIFTLGNMETHAADIQQQVFIKKRMPKGKKFPLTEEESLALKTWLATLSIP